MLKSFKHHLKVAGRESYLPYPRLITPVQFRASFPARRFCLSGFCGRAGTGAGMLPRPAPGRGVSAARSGARMGLLVALPEPVDRDMGIDLGGRQLL